MQKLKVHLSETHRLAILHQPSLRPNTLVQKLDAFGKISLSSAYILTDDNIITLISFSESQSSDRCYDMLKGNVVNKHHSDIMPYILNVGWAHEESERDFLKKSYIREKFTESDEHAKKEPESGYLVIFLEHLAAHEREGVAQIVKKFAVEDFSDMREGGRLFAKLLNEQLTEDCRCAVLERFRNLGNAVSYADALEFNLAKKSNKMI
ncbi:unnamed protein product, partial [Phytomonas sp. Hart1]